MTDCRARAYKVVGTLRGCSPAVVGGNGGECPCTTCVGLGLKVVPWDRRPRQQHISTDK